MKIRQNSESGTVLMTTVVILGLVTLVVAALLTIVQRQNNFTARSMTWCSEIPLAEAGIEEAMAHLGNRPKNFATDGWKMSGSNCVKTRYFTNTPGTIADGYFYATIFTSRPPRIVSIGFGRIPAQTNYTQRTVMVMTKENPPPYAIVAKQTITLGGSGSDKPWVDSFDSTDPDYSTDGQYDPLKRNDRAGVATLSSAVPAINTGSGEIWGFATTGPAGIVTGTVGDGSWCNTTSGLQPNHVRNDFNLAIPNVSEPVFAAPSAIPNSWILANKDYVISGDLERGFIVQGDARLWVQGNVKLTSGEIKISAGKSLEIFIGRASGPDVTATFGGNGIQNELNTARSCKIWGLPTCKDLKFSGSASLTGVIYAPHADVRMSGTSDVYGAITANSFNCTGSMGIHQDNSLFSQGTPLFTIISWEEL